MTAIFKQSAGILLYRLRENELEVLLVHPGGPFWAKKDLGAWSVPKGEFDTGENPLVAAMREFEEEIGQKLPDGIYRPLGAVRQKSGKTVCAWALEYSIDASTITSNTVFVEWPPRSGKQLEIPEIDRAEWFSVEKAKTKINPAQAAFVERLDSLLRIE